jgi:hypothetical protein
MAPFLMDRGGNYTPGNATCMPAHVVFIIQALTKSIQNFRCGIVSGSIRIARGAENKRKGKCWLRSGKLGFKHRVEYVFVYIRAYGEKYAKTKMNQRRGLIDNYSIAL